MKICSITTLFFCGFAAVTGFTQTPQDSARAHQVEVMEVVEVEPVPEQPTDRIYEMMEIQKSPAFPGGDMEMIKFLANTLQYPALARANDIQGTVVLSFVVLEDGNITELTVLKDIGGGCGKEAMRVVNLMPQWTPGRLYGRPVKVRYTLPVRFK